MEDIRLNTGGSGRDDRFAGDCASPDREDAARRARGFRREADRARRFASEQTNAEIQTALILYAEELEAAAEAVERDPSYVGPRKSS